MQTYLEYIVAPAFIAFLVVGMIEAFTGVFGNVPYSIPHFAHGTLAPYKSYSTHYKHLHIELQQPDGTWNTVSTKRYWPFLFGERSVRSLLLSFAPMGKWHANTSMYSVLAERILAAEQTRNTPITRVRLTLQEWPLSFNGIEYYRKDPYLTTFFTVEYP